MQTRLKVRRKRNLPTNITETHVLLAMKAINLSGIPPGQGSKGVSVHHGGRAYPCKLVLRSANLFANGQFLECFTTADAVRILTKLKFDVSRNNDNRFVTVMEKIHNEMETHPRYDYFNPCSGLKGGYLPAGTETVIIGTAPPEREYIYDVEGFFYFSSPWNHFYNRIDSNFRHVAGYTALKKTATRNTHETRSENRKRKESFFRSNGIGFIDIFARFTRTNPGSTKDADLIPVETITENGSFDALIKGLNIKRVCCVYSLAYETLEAYLSKNSNYNVREMDEPDAAGGKKLTVEGFGKTFEVLLLFPATRSSHKGELKDAQYRKFLFQ